MPAARSAAHAIADSIASPRDSVVLRLPEFHVDRDRVLSAARERLPTAFVSDLTPRRDARAVETVADVLSEAAGVHVDSYGGLGAFATVSLRVESPSVIIPRHEPETSAGEGPTPCRPARISPGMDA